MFTVVGSTLSTLPDAIRSEGYWHLKLRMANDVEFHFDIKWLLNCLIKFGIKSCPFVLQIVPCVHYDGKFKYLEVFHSIRSQDTVYCIIPVIQLPWLPRCFTNNHQIYAQISSNGVQFFFFKEFWNNNHTILSYQGILRRINVEFLASIGFIAVKFHSHRPTKRAFKVCPIMKVLLQ